MARTDPGLFADYDRALARVVDAGCRGLAVQRPGIRARRAHGRMDGARRGADVARAARDGARRGLRHQPHGVRSRMDPQPARSVRRRHARQLPQVTRSVPADRRGIDGSFRRLRTRPVLPAVAGRRAAQLLQSRDARSDVGRARVHRASTATASAATWRCSCSTRCSPDTGAGRVDLLWRAPADEFWPAAIAPRAAPDLPRGGVLGSRVGAAAAGISLHLRQAAARSAAPRRTRRRSAATCRRTRPTARRLVRFLENHDEPRSAADVRRTSAGGRRALPYALPGMRFFFDGQFEGAEIRTPVQLGRWPDEAARAGRSAICTAAC